MKLWKPWILWGYFYLVNTNEHLCSFCNVYNSQEFNFNVLLVKLVYIIDQWCVSWKPVLRWGYWLIENSKYLFAFFCFSFILFLNLSFCWTYVINIFFMRIRNSKEKKNDILLILFFNNVYVMWSLELNNAEYSIDLHEVFKLINA